MPNYFRKPQQLFTAISRSQAAMDECVRVNAGTISPAEFFAPRNVEAILAAGSRV